MSTMERRKALDVTQPSECARRKLQELANLVGIQLNVPIVVAYKGPPRARHFQIQVNGSPVVMHDRKPLVFSPSTGAIYLEGMARAASLGAGDKVGGIMADVDAARSLLDSGTGP